MWCYFVEWYCMLWMIGWCWLWKLYVVVVVGEVIGCDGIYYGIVVD